MRSEWVKVSVNVALLGWLCLVLIGTGCNKSSSNDLIIATSANMQYAMKDLIEAFEKENDISCRTVVSSSGKLTAQISSGAPYDLFFSADKKYPEQLFQQGLTIDTPSVYAYGHLALWSMTLEEKDLLDLSVASVKRIAIANPKTAPYGIAAQQMLDHYNYSEVAKKLVFGESISQVNQFVSSEVVDIGVTSLSVVLSPILEKQGHWIKVDATSYGPIAQSMVTVSKKKEKLESARLFKKFIGSAKAHNILKEFGFTF